MGSGDIHIVVDLDSPSLSGRVVASHARARPFSGWLGLITALRAEIALLGAAAAGPAREPACPVPETSQEDR